ncbi:MAG: hypothetical protein AAF636_27610 [Pseudomonadota bacterium]
MKNLEILKLSAVCLDNLTMSDVRMFELSGSRSIVPKLEAIGKTVIHPKMDPLKNDFTDRNCFWLMLEKKGQLFGCVGARLEDIGDESPVSYWARTAERHYPESNLPRFDHVSPEMLKAIRGKVAYMGDLHFHANYRGTAWTNFVLRNLLLLLHINIQINWRVDCTYAFLRRKDYLNAKAEQYHYMRNMPGYQRWDEPPEGRSKTESLLTMPRKEFEHLVAYLNQNPEELAWKPL